MSVEPSPSSKYKDFLQTYFSRFSFSFLGTGLILVWIQCILYARYIWVDNGATTIAINFARCLCIAVVGAIVLKRPFSNKGGRIWGLVSISCMTAGSLLFFLEQTMPGLHLNMVASVLAGVGLAWGGGIWITFYSRLDIKEALLCTFLSLSLSTVIGIAIGLMPQDIAYFISMILPITTYIMYQQAQRKLDERERDGYEPAPVEKPLYDTEPKSTMIRLIIGIALFSFVLGFSRGFPFGPSIELPPAFQVLQHTSVTLIGLVIVWWSLIQKRRLKFSVLWQAQLAALALGVLLLATFDPTATLFGATLIAITNLFQVAFLWFLSYDAARFRSEPPYIVLGFFWILHLLFRELGRLAILVIGPSQTIGFTILIAVMICLIAISMGFLLTDNIPRSRPFFGELCSCDKAPTAQTAHAKASAIETSSEGGRSGADEPESWAKSLFGLTQREAEVATLLAQGRTSTYIASELFLSNETVRSYVKTIYAKTDVHSKQELIDLFNRHSSDAAS